MFLLPKLTKYRSSRIFLTMPVTRSRSKAAGGSIDQQLVSVPKKKTRTGKQPVSVANSRPVTVGTAVVPGDPGFLPALVPAELSFSFEEAKQHLITADSRFQDVFDIAVCTPYQKLDRVEPFR